MRHTAEAFEEKARGDYLLREEQEILIAACQDGDASAGEKILKAYDEHIRNHAMAYADRRKKPWSEEAYIAAQTGFYLAILKYDAAQEAGLATYAAWWMDAELGEYFWEEDSARLSRMGRLTTTAIRSALYHLSLGAAPEEVHRHMQEKKGGQSAITPKTRSRKKSVTPGSGKVVTLDTVYEYVRILRHGGMDSLDRSVTDEDYEVPLGAILLADQPTTEEALMASELMHKRRRILAAFTETLTDRERIILQKRKLTTKPVTHEQLAVELDIGKSRVDQIEKDTLRRLIAYAYTHGGAELFHTGELCKVDISALHVKKAPAKKKRLETI